MLIGGQGNDILDAGAGDDTIVTGVGYNATRGAIYGFRFDSGYDGGDDVIDGGTGDDIAYLLYGNRSAGITLSIADPASANVILSGGVAAGSIVNVERIVFSGGSGGDVITGGARGDSINGNDGDDRLYGGGGGDELTGGKGHNILDGGSGSDTARFGSASSVDLALQGSEQQTGEFSFDTLVSIENLRGSRYTDQFLGDNAANQLTDNNGGNDFFYGYGGDDRLSIVRTTSLPTDPDIDSSASSVTLNGGQGNDTLSFNGSGRYLDIARLDGEQGDDVITAASLLAATIDASDGADRVSVDARGGSYIITLGSGSDTLTLTYAAATSATPTSSPASQIVVTDFATGAGGDSLDLDSVIASGLLTNYIVGTNPFDAGYVRLRQDGANTVLDVDRNGGGDGFASFVTFNNAQAASFSGVNFGGYGQPLTGTAQADVLTGDGARDLLSGFDGDDSLNGLAGNDVLIGGAGRDMQTGGSGTDEFRGTHADFAGDTIVDLAAGDRIHVTDAGAGFGVTQAGRTLTLSTGEALTLTNGAMLSVRAQAAGDGGYDILAIARAVDNDWNGDGRSDILWRNTAGTLTDWYSTGTSFDGATGFNATVTTDWSVAGNGDFNGDGRSDILWRNASGRITDWVAPVHYLDSDSR